MQDILSMLSSLRRPRLLIRAARCGAEEYRRENHLQRLLGYGTLPRPAQALLMLMDQEKELDSQRRDGDAAYSLVRHIDVLIAMMGEAHIVRHAQSAVAQDVML